MARLTVVCCDFTSSTPFVAKKERSSPFFGVFDIFVGIARRLCRRRPPTTHSAGAGKDNSEPRWIGRRSRRELVSRTEKETIFGLVATMRKRCQNAERLELIPENPPCAWFAAASGDETFEELLAGVLNDCPRFTGTGLAAFPE